MDSTILMPNRGIHGMYWLAYASPPMNAMPTHAKVTMKVARLIHFGAAGWSFSDSPAPAPAPSMSRIRARMFTGVLDHSRHEEHHDQTKCHVDRIPAQPAGLRQRGDLVQPPHDDDGAPVDEIDCVGLVHAREPDERRDEQTVI